MATVTEMWECGDCGELHDDEDDAAQCCPPLVRCKYVCMDCKQTYSIFSEAESCCDADQAPAGPTPQELEAAGQTRLFA